MANNYFQFKQFTVYQDHCAMKVCTDACIFGAWIAAQVSNEYFNAKSFLDIGAGTGLLSLMLAQKTSGAIDAVEVDEAAAQQARRNFESSPWNTRLQVFNKNALAFTSEKKYDCIISNPPFFEEDLRSPDKKKNAAKHETTLTLEQLLTVIKRQLSNAGFFAVLLPFHRVDFFNKIAASANYFLNAQLLIRHSERHQFFRGILLFSSTQTMTTNEELSIKNEAGNYTDEFIELMKDYYLHL